MAARFFRHPRAFALALLLILSMGLSAALTSGRQEDPTITNLFATILTPYPGADPARVEALVTEKIEQELRKVSEIDEIVSISRGGLSFLRVQLVETLSDAAIETAWTDIRNALEDAARAFPPGVPEPEFTNDRINAYTLIFALTAAEGGGAGGRAARPARRAFARRRCARKAERRCGSATWGRWRGGGPTRPKASRCSTGARPC